MKRIISHPDVEYVDNFSTGNVEKWDFDMSDIVSKTKRVENVEKLSTLPVEKLSEILL